VVRAVSPAQAGSPGAGSENHYRQEEEDAGHFKPEDSPNTAKGAQKTADPAGKPVRGLACDLPGGAATGVGLVGTGAGSRRWLAGRSLGAGSYALAGNASGDADTDAESAANGMRLHFDSMVTVRLPVPLCAGVDGLRVARKRRWN
jgi:hypothetical protein